MPRSTRWQLLSAFLAGALTFGGIVAVAQSPPPSAPPSGPAAGTSRDNFGPHAARRTPRLSREELDKFTAEEAAAEAAEERSESPARPRAAAAAPQSHRLTRDVMLGRPTAASHHGPKEWQITLKNTFIEKYKNRATLTTPFRVIAYTTHPPPEDGDTHVAGLGEDVGLACVAEIMNWKFFQGAVTAVKAKKASGETVQVTGAWRLWCEHPDAVPETAGPQVQDDVIPDFNTSNPNHVFEIHPISRFGDIPLEDSFEPIDGYSPKDAVKAFQIYESLPCRIVPDPANQTTTLFTPKVGYNYVKFMLKVEDEQQFITVDGRIVRCSVLALDGTPIVENRRMIFVKGTPPEQAIRTKTKGDTLRVLGIPRIDLALVSYRTRVADTKPEALDWSLPYELIVVALEE
jgi:hypothetical protein